MAFRIVTRNFDIEIDSDRACLWVYMPQATVKVDLESVSARSIVSAFQGVTSNYDTFVSHCSLYCGGHVETCIKHGYQDPEGGPGCPDCRRDMLDAALQTVRLAEKIWTQLGLGFDEILHQEVKINLSEEWVNEHVW